MATELSRSTYLEKNVGNYPATVEIAGKLYEKVEDLRYGTNPHQPAAFYRPVNSNGAIGSMEILKNGKSVLLDYLAVTPEYRDRGIGSEVLRALQKYYRGKADFIMIESEHPLEAPDENAALRRLDFYKRAGARLTDTQVRLFDILFLIFVLPCGNAEETDTAAEMEKIYRVTVPPEL